MTITMTAPADLVRSLIHPPPTSQPKSQSLHNASSNESFHSTGSQPTQHHAISSQHGSLPIYDIESYLAKEDNGVPIPKSHNKASKTPLANAINSADPVPLGSKTSHHVATLNSLCQAKAFPTPIYDLKQESYGLDARFTGTVTVGEVTINSDNHYRNKKEAKEGLAAAALPTIQSLSPQERAKPIKDPTTQQPQKNWIDLLQQYHNAIYGGTQSPLYDYFALGTAFSATCTIPTHQARTFGSPATAHPSKKTAQTAAAREAVECLISEGKLNGDGTCPGGARKKQKPNAASSNSDSAPPSPAPSITLNPNNTVSVSSSSSYAQRVADLAPLLGVSQPQYQLSAGSAAAPNMLSGYASFANWGGVEALRGEVGEARNVFGRKNAREEVARGVWDVLVRLAEGRGVRVVGGEGG